MKRVLALLAVILVMATLATAQTGARKKVFFTNAYLTAPYCAPMTEAMTAYAKANNLDLQIVDGDGDSQKQLDQIKNAVTKGVDGIVYFPADAASTIPVVRYLSKCGVPFVVLNSKADESVMSLVPAYVGLDYEYSGSIGGKIAADVLGKKGGNVVVIEGAGGTEVALGYEAGFEKTALLNKNVKIIAKQQADWDPAKAMKVMEDYITTFGSKIDFIYSHDDGMFTGIAQALKDAGLLGKIPVVCNGQSQFVLDSIAKGDILGSASQDPRWEGTTSLKVLQKLMKKEKAEAWSKTECLPITKANVSKFKGW